MNKREEYIDALKGVAIICVVIGHIANGYIGNGLDTGAYHNVYNIIYSFHMPLFFTISGYCFGKAYIDADGLKTERIKRQIINMTMIYLFFSMLMGFSKMIMGRYVNEATTLKDILLIPLKPIQLHWYIYVLIFYYIVLFLLYGRLVNKIIVIVGLIAFNILSHYLMPNMVFDLKHMMFFMIFFMYGLAFVRRETDIPGWISYLLILTSIALIATFWEDKRYICEIPVINTLVALCITTGLLVIFKKSSTGYHVKLVESLGRHSLEIYLLHTYFVTALRAISNKTGIENYLVIILSGTIIGIAGPLIISELLRKLGLFGIFFNPYDSFIKKRTA